MGRTSMPKATVYENNKMLSWKYKIRLPEQGMFSSPTLNAVISEKPSQDQFRAFVSRRTDEGHDIRSLLLGENIRHDYQSSSFHANAEAGVRFTQVHNPIVMLN